MISNGVVLLLLGRTQPLACVAVQLPVARGGSSCFGLGSTHEFGGGPTARTMPAVISAQGNGLKGPRSQRRRKAAAEAQKPFS